MKKTEKYNLIYINDSNFNNTEQNNNINNEVKTVYTAHVAILKERNKKYIFYVVLRKNKYTDIYGNVEYSPASQYIKDMLVENTKIKYKRYDKKAINKIEKLKNYILNTYNIDNKDEFISNYTKIMS